jgi:hypothetical protein
MTTIIPKGHTCNKPSFFKIKKNKKTKKKKKKQKKERKINQKKN